MEEIEDTIKPFRKYLTFSESVIFVEKSDLSQHFFFLIFKLEKDKPASMQKREDRISEIMSFEEPKMFIANIAYIPQTRKYLSTFPPISTKNYLKKFISTKRPVMIQTTIPIRFLKLIMNNVKLRVL